MIGIKWRGATLDPSGYGSANRDYIVALHEAGANITVEPWNYEARPAEFYGEAGRLVNSLKNNDIDYQFIVHHYVPNRIKMEEGDEQKINVGYSTWEADIIPEHWVENINQNFDLQLVPSEYNRQAYVNSGVKIPVEVVPHCIDVTPFDETEPACMPKYENHFKFLSVFQWIERKNPVGLMKAYFSEFYGCSDVILILKTYGINHSEQERERIKATIRKLKYDTQLEPNKLPKIYLLPELLSREEMLSLYKAADCFVLPTRSEGFGIPFAEACAGENVVIAPKHGGQRDFLRDGDGSFVRFVPHQLTPVAHMPFPHYNSLMTWAEPDLYKLAGIMGTYYRVKHSSPDTFKSYKTMARKHVKETLNHEKVGQRFMWLLMKIKQEIGEKK